MFILFKCKFEIYIFYLITNLVPTIVIAPYDVTSIRAQAMHEQTDLL